MVEVWLWHGKRIVHHMTTTVKTNASDSHSYLVGATLCSLLDGISASEMHGWPVERELLGASAARILLHGVSVAGLEWEELVDVVSGPQIELPSMIYWDDERGGYVT